MSTARDVEREQVEWVFGLTGGELEEAPLKVAEEYDEKGVGFGFWEGDGKARYSRTWHYWYVGVPEWAQGDFGPDYDSSEWITIVETGVCYDSRAQKIQIDDDGSIWMHVASYTHSGESECPEGEAGTWDIPGEPCPLCDETAPAHGCIYLGDSAEHVYRKMGCVRGSHPEDGSCDCEEVEQLPGGAFRLRCGFTLVSGSV